MNVNVVDTQNFNVDRVEGQCVRIKGGEWFLSYHLTKVNYYDII